MTVLVKRRVFGRRVDLDITALGDMVWYDGMVEVISTRRFADACSGRVGEQGRFEIRNK